jgi:hypothetical protein
MGIPVAAAQECEMERRFVLKSLLVAMAIGAIGAASIVVGADLFTVSRAGKQHSSLDQEVNSLARQILRDAHAAGFIDVTEVSSGRQIAYVGVTAEGKDDSKLAADALVPPLSVIKVFVAAEWIEHGFADTAVDCTSIGGRAVRRMRVDEMLTTGCDSAGAQMAIILRQKLGAEIVLRDLRRFGLSHLTLRADASDADWGTALTLGERDVLASAQEISAFLRAIAQGEATVVSAEAARRLRTMLDDVVARGTATSVKDVLAGTGWRIGGKTGTGPGDCGDHCDGWFASIASDGEMQRYIILAYVRGKGLGSGVAAHAAAAIARRLAEAPAR